MQYWVCDLCGKLYSKKEWESFNDSLCPKCSKKLFEKISKKIDEEIVKEVRKVRKERLKIKNK
jgi:phage FluMu protein Com